MAVDVFRPATEHLNGSRAGGSTAAANRIAAWGTGVALALGIAAGAAHLVDWAVYDFRIPYLDLSTHASVFGVVSLLSLVAVAAALTRLAATRSVREPTVLALLTLAVVLLALRVAHPAHVILAALPLTAVTFVLLWWKLEPRASAARRVIRLGCLTLAASFVLHAFGASAVSALGYDVGTWAYQIQLVVEHCAELAGWILIATGVAALGYAPRESAER